MSNFICTLTKIVLILLYLQNFTSAYFGTKTPYSLYRFLDSSPRFDINKLPQEFKDEYKCVRNSILPDYLISVLRHASRNPSLVYMKKAAVLRSYLVQHMDSLMDRASSGSSAAARGGALSGMRTCLSPDVGIDWIDWTRRLRKWSPSFLDDPDLARALIPIAVDELRLLATYARTLTQAPCSAMRFTSSDTDRTRASLQYFQKEFCAPESAPPEPVLDDSLLRFYDHCFHYTSAVLDNPDALDDLNTYKRSQHVVEELNRISNMLRLPPLEYGDLSTSYLLCATDVAHHLHNVSGPLSHSTIGHLFNQSPWCTLMQNNTLAILEFGADLKKYLKCGPAFPVTILSSCVFWRRLLSDVEQTLAGERASRRAHFLFGHAETILHALGLLGLFHEEGGLPPQRLWTPRNYSTRRITPFAAHMHLLAFRYTCDAGDASVDALAAARTRIFLVLNERLERLHLCASSKSDGGCWLHEMHAYIESRCGHPDIYDREICHNDREHDEDDNSQASRDEL